MNKESGMFSSLRFIVAGCMLLVVSIAGAAEPEWLWSSPTPRDNETALFRKSFTLGSDVRSAVACVAGDDEVMLFVNGRQAIRRHSSWKEPAIAGLSDQLKKGTNVLAIRGRNSRSSAGVILQLDLELRDGTKQSIVTDGSWKATTRGQQGWQNAEFDDANWQTAHSLGKLGIEPWGSIRLDPASQPMPQATPADKIAVAPGFEVELLYSVPGPQQGSWVAMTADDRGRLIVSDQDGALYRVVAGEKGKPVDVERLSLEIGQAQGLLYAASSLYVVVNGNAAEGSGLYRVRDTNNDDQFDEIRLLRKIQGNGEHGPHAVVLSPDGRSLYVAGGNHTKIPEPESSLVPRNWEEDQLLPRMWDAGGHAVGILAPGGWICRTDLDGKKWELVSSGYRNQYDIAFNAAGELFTYDSDMEWDIGAPWYRPTRVCHATSGSEFGWRSGSGVWPDYYPDNLPATVNIGPGSPTGIMFGTGAKFPAKFQQALFLCDWSYGNIYIAHLTPNGASYTGDFERFATASPLPVTDLIVNPKDGAMYFTVGGRRTQSGLYRITYTGDEPTANVQSGEDAGAESRALRHRLEQFHGKQASDAIEIAWPHLSNPDRFIRYAARIAIEHQPIDTWKEKVLHEKNPVALIEASIALARCGSESLMASVVESLGSIPWDELSEANRLGVLRAYGLVFARWGQPSADIREKAIAKFDGKFPAASPALNYELSRLLIYLEAPRVAERCLALIRQASTQEESIHYSFLLRNLKTGWTLDQRREYFAWFNDSRRFRGGHSFAGFLLNAKNEAIQTLNDQQREALAAVLEAPVPTEPPAPEGPPRPLVREWTVAELSAGIDEALHNRNFQRGREMFAAASCFKCHRFAGEGGIIGPDLTGVGRRFTNQYLVETLIEPSKTISDQYQASVFVTKDGRTIVGKVANLNGDDLKVITNMLEPGTMTNINRREIDEQYPSPISMMPTGLLNTLTKDEILDLLAYLRSGGSPDHEVFK